MVVNQLHFLFGAEATKYNLLVVKDLSASRYQSRLKRVQQQGAFR
jgi:hypothetical protein